ncbi:MAG: hypothetical protein LCH67_11780 [Bacteroidetes bacterium]|nr:hypothetical protein [Bacteroidota bacterium]
MSKNTKFDFIKDLFVPIIIAIVVVIINNFVFLNQKMKETKMEYEQAILVNQYEVLNRILLFCIKHHQNNKVIRLKESVWEKYTFKLDSISQELKISRDKNLEEKIKSLNPKIIFHPNNLSAKELDSLYYVVYDLPNFLTDSSENKQFNEDIAYFSKNIGLIDHRIAVLVQDNIIGTKNDFKYSGALLSYSEAKKQNGQKKKCLTCGKVI